MVAPPTNRSRPRSPRLGSAGKSVSSAAAVNIAGFKPAHSARRIRGVSGGGAGIAARDIGCREALTPRAGGAGIVARASE